MPLIESRDCYQAQFLANGMSAESFFYISELILYSEYRGKGIGEKLYNEVETIVKEENLYPKITCCTIQIAKDDPSMPKNYKYADYPLWVKLGFKKYPSISYDSYWVNIGDEAESAHHLVFWIKALKVDIESESSLKLAHKYLSFINGIGSGEDRDGDHASQLFSEDCRKYFNGRWVALDRSSFIADLLFVYKKYGSWKLVPVEILPNSCLSRIILWINIEGQSFGKNAAIVILRYDSNNLVNEIIEVFSPIEDCYAFDEAN